MLGSTYTAREVRRLASERGVKGVVVTAGMTASAGSDVRIDVRHPPPGLVPGTAPTSNDNSVVLKVTMGSVSFLLTGDIEERGLSWLLRDPKALRSTVLKVPHHGSRLGEAGARVFHAVHPQLAVLSVGRLHHLPAPDTLHALEETGAALYTTRDDGAIALRTDGTCVDVRTFKHPVRVKPVGPSFGSCT